MAATSGIKYKYNEREFLAQAFKYIEGTYGEHYAHEINDKGMQLFDLWDGMDILEPTCQANALKYVARFGKKDGYNRRDLYKAIHYITMMAYLAERDHDRSETDNGVNNDDVDEPHSE